MTKIVHIGLPKTGTTFLQKEYFPYLNKPFYTPEGFINDNFNYLKYCNRNFELLANKYNPLNIKFIFNKAREEYWLRKLKAVPDNSLVSSEGFCGFCLSPNRNIDNQIYVLKNYYKFDKIIFIFRYQLNFALSIYKQAVLKENRWNGFFDFDTVYGLDEPSWVRFSELDWNYSINVIHKYYKPENVLCLPYEMLNSDSSLFFTKINDFIGCKEILINNVIHNKTDNFFDKYLSNQCINYNDLDCSVKNLLYISNVELSKHSGLDLSDFGYY